ncbi:hypothetical protein [Micromonospora sp. NBC_01740]|uniref:hypothetical protein n=1 Tax=unclassified Micromonospora TaxID=2617518 RepID=UPI002E112F2E|nr:hypothetical protein OG989_06935 [Micromonospora sp. NBC_01740]
MTSLPHGGARRVVGAFAVAVLLPVLVGCAAPGSDPTSAPAGGVAPADGTTTAGGTAPAASTAPDGGVGSARPVTSPAPPEADCVRAGTPVARPGQVAPSGGGVPAVTSRPPGTRQPLTDEQRRAEEFRRQQAANDAFRQRGTLGEEAASGARACAADVRKSLKLLTAGGRDEPGQEAVRRAIVATGLTGVTVRPPGRLDLGPVDGLVFAGWTGRACVFGSVRAGDVTVEIGTRIADGGCLPAPS